MTLRSSRLLAAVGVLGFILAAWLALEPSKSTALQPTDPALVPGAVVHGPATQKTIDVGSRQQVPNTASFARSPGAWPWLKVHLVGAPFSEPLLGQIESEMGQFLGGTDAQGFGLIRLDPNVASPLTFQATGYEPQQRVFEASSADREWAVELVPLLSATVEVVTPQGAPVEGVEVRIRRDSYKHPGNSWRSSPLPVGSVQLKGTTDSAGRFSCPLVGLAVAEIHSPYGGIVSARLAPGETVRVLVHFEGATLTFVDGTSGDPLADFLVETLDTLNPRAREVRRTTNSQGEIFLAAGSRELVVELKDLSSRSASCTPHPRVTQLGSGYAFRFSDLQDGDAHEIRVERCSYRLKLVDSQTGQPINGRVDVQFESGIQPKDQDPRWVAISSLSFEARLVDGEFEVDCPYISSRGVNRLRLTVSGYSPALVPHSRLTKELVPNTVVMTLGTSHVRLRVLYANGEPCLGRFVIADLATGSHSAIVKNNSEGYLPALAWGGGDLDVFNLSRKNAEQSKLAGHSSGGFGGPNDKRLMGHVRRNEVIDGLATLTLDSVPESGRLEIQAVPVGAAILFALDEDGNRRQASDQNDHISVFDGLPNGEHVVGPARWLDLLETQFLRYSETQWKLLATQVTADKTNVTQWDPRWQLQSPLEGRVHCAPESLSELALRPWYAYREGRVGPKDDVRLFLDAQGRYRIPAGEPRPEVLLVCPANSSLWPQVLQAFEPGQDCTLSFGSMTLEWEGERPKDGTVTAFFRPEDPAFDTQFIELQLNSRDRAWNMLQPLTFGSVSTDVRKVGFNLRSGETFSLPVEIRVGENTLVRVRKDG